MLGVSKDATPTRSRRSTASWPVNSIRTRTPVTRPKRSSRRSPRRTTCSPTKPSAGSTTRASVRALSRAAASGAVAVAVRPAAATERQHRRPVRGLGGLRGHPGRDLRRSNGGTPSRHARAGSQSSLTLVFVTRHDGVTVPLRLSIRSACAPVAARGPRLAPFRACAPSATERADVGSGRFRVRRSVRDLPRAWSLRGRPLPDAATASAAA